MFSGVATSYLILLIFIFLRCVNLCRVSNKIADNAQVFLQAGNSLLVLPGQPKLKVKIKADD